MIEIKITDPHLMDKNALRKTVTYLLGMIGDELKQATPPEKSQLAPLSAINGHSEPLAPPAPAVNPFANSANPFAELPPPVKAPVAPPVPMPPPAFVPPALPPTSVTTLPPVAPARPSVDVDANGLPWDNRIHSRGKSKLANGCWKVKRELNPALLQQVEAELRQAISAPAPLVAPPVNPQVPGIPVSPFVADPIAPAQNDFPYLMALVTECTTTNRITSAEVNEIVKGFGIPSFPLTATRPDLVPSIIDAIKAKVGA